MNHMRHTARKGRIVMFKRLAPVLIATAALTAPAVASADVVSDWNRTMVDALEVDKTPPPPSARVGAIVQSAVFDAVNGIARRYTPMHVLSDAPRGASPAAAAAGAAHEALVTLFPAQQATLDQRLADTIAQIADASTADDRSITEGLQWGKTVADETLAWRATDGFNTVPPSYAPAGTPGRWAPTPPAFVLMPLFRQFATMTPFALASPNQFLPAPPPPMTSARYARDFNEVKALGSANSTIRTPEQTETAIFWQSDTPTAIWNRVADDLAQQRGRSMLAGARILALMNISLADSAIAIWNAKNTYDTWRPITAIQQADSDSNPDTSPDRNWTPLLTTPAFQEYPAGHPGVSNGGATVLASFYGDDTPFTATSNSLTGVKRSFTSLSSAIEQVENARVWGGIHFRTASVTAAHMGAEVAQYVTQTRLLPLHEHNRHHDGD
jgi:PAP2 superfamily